MNRRLIPEGLPDPEGGRSIEDESETLMGKADRASSGDIDPLQERHGSDPMEQDMETDKQPLSSLFTDDESPDSIEPITDDEQDDMKLAAYLRVSTERQAADDRYGVDRQRHDVELFSRRNGDEHEVVIEYVEVTSGTNGIERREAFPEMLARLEEGGIDGIVLPDLTRLSRSLTTQEALLAAIWSRGGKVYTVDGFEVPQDDPDDPMRTAMRQMAGVFAQLERSMIAKRLRDGRKSKARRLREQGGAEYAWTFAPFGFRKTDAGTVVPDDGSAERRVVELILRLQDDGLTLRDVASALNDQGVLAPRGGDWTATQVSRVIQRERRYHAEAS